MCYGSDELREQLMDYYGTAMTSGMPMAVVDLVNIEQASDEDIIQLARNIGLYEDDIE